MLREDKKLRNDAVWENTFEKCIQFVQKHDVAEPNQSRISRKKPFMVEMGVDEPISDHKQRLKFEMYFEKYWIPCNFS